MYRKIPKTKKAASVFFVIVLLGVGLFLIFMGGIRLLPLPILAQFIGISCTVAAVFILSQRTLKDFTYEIATTERDVSEEEILRCGERAKYDFLVYERRGWRDIAVCRVGLDEVRSATEMNPANKKEFKRLDREKKRYTYDAQFAAWRRLRLQINDDTVVYLTFDRELFDILNS